MAYAAEVRKQLVTILGDQYVKDDAVTLYSYRADGLTLHPATPMGVLWPGTVTELQAVVRLLSGHGLSFLPRGAGTGLSGGAIPSQGSTIIEMFRFNTIGAIDAVNRTITVGPGVVNLHVSQASASDKLCFVPDPSSQKACTIGGNVAENSGGPHTLKYGVTTNHILAMEVVLPDGELVQLGGPVWGVPGPDLLGLFIGSEGTFGIVTSVTCRLTPLPERVETMLGVFSSVEDACNTVSQIIRQGIVPAALEMIDKIVISATERTTPAGFPTDAEAVLIIELEDLADGLDEEVAAIQKICMHNHAREVRLAADVEERARIWAARKGAFAALGSISPSFYTQDGVIPRATLPQVLARVLEVGKKYGLIVANVFHAGDGNLHPLILYDSKDAAQVLAVQEAGREILEICVEVGGTLSGEHGIGLEKTHLMYRVFNEADIENMLDVRAVFNSNNFLNPGKIFPNPSRCAETKLIAGKTGAAV